MKNSALLKILVAVIAVLTVPLAAQALQVQAIVDKNQITLEDAVFLQVEVTGGKAEVDLSHVTDFKVIPRGSSSLTSIINGKMEKKFTHNYILMPLKKGKLTIPQIQVVYKGDEAFTKPITIFVAEAETSAAGEAKALFAKASASRSHLVAGQQAVYSLEFFTSRRLSGVGFESAPDFNGVSVKPFDKETTYTRTINGVLYQVTRVDYLIIPQQGGTVTINPAVLVANVIVKSNRRSQFDPFFNDPFFTSRESRPVRVRSNPVTLTVSPLPAYLGDHAFSGLIGQFDIEAAADQVSLKAGESMTLTIRISGNGNIMDAGVPDLTLPEEQFKVYDDSPAESIRLTSSGYEGYKEFKRAIVPVKPGRFTIPGMKLTYFDVKSNRYQTIESKAIVLDVIPSEKILLTPAPQEKGPAASAPEKQAVSLVNRDILELKEGIQVLENTRQMSPGLFLGCLLAPALLFLGVRVFVSVRQKEVPLERAMGLKAKDCLKQADKAGPGGEGFWGHLYSALVSAVLSRAGRKGETLVPQEARQILEKAGASLEQVDEALDLLETIESVRFGGTTADNAKAGQVLDRIRKLIKSLGLFVALIVLVGVVQTDTAAAGTAKTAETYLGAVKEYRQGKYQSAAQKLEQVAKTPITNPDLFYNIGNAYLKADDIGRAVLWYERAKRMAPNDPDLRFNLAHARSLTSDQTEEGKGLIDIIFFWDNLIPVKTLQIACVCLSMIFFAWAAIRTIVRKPIFSGTGIAIFSLFFLISIVTGIGLAKQTRRSYAVIVASAADVRSGVTPNATKLFTLHTGTKVRVDEQRDEYLKIFFSKDKVGWVKKNLAEII